MHDRSRSIGRVGCLVVAAALFALTISAPAASAESTSGVPLTTGDNSLGQQGDGGTVARTIAGPVSLSGIVSIASGRDDGYALDGAHQVWAWGTNSMGEVGDGTTTTRRTPVRVLTDVAQIEAGHDHGIALKLDGTVWTWGYGGLGQLGLGTTNNRTVPAQVPGLSDIRAVAAGRDMSYAIRPDGTLMGWGNNTFGEVGDGTKTRRTTPVPVQGLSQVIEIVGGRNHGLARTADGSVWAWGDNTYGQLGDGTTTGRSIPVKVLDGAAHLAAGAHHSIASLTDGRVMTWGRGYRGALGSGSTSNRLVPTAVAGLPAVATVGDGRDTSFAITTGGEVYAWGDNGSGQLGDGTRTMRTSPVHLSSVSGVTAVQGGALHTVFMPAPAGTSTNQPPQAHFSRTCTSLDCQFDASSSTDPDGTVTSAFWSFGDGATGDGTHADHRYPAAGSYDVVLTVTDDDGAVSAPMTQTITVTDTPPPPSVIAFRAATNATANATASKLNAPSAIQAGDQLLLLLSTNTQTAVTAPPNGWVLLRQQLDGTDLRTLVYVRTATGTDAGALVTTTFAAQTKSDATILAYSGVKSAISPVAASGAETATLATHLSPAVAIAFDGSWVVSAWNDKSTATSSWTVVQGQTVRSESIGTGTGRLTSVVSDTAGPVPSGSWAGSAATASEASGKATMWSIVLSPAG